MPINQAANNIQTIIVEEYNEFPATRGPVFGQNNNYNHIQKFSIRFHFKSGKQRDMWIDPTDYHGNVNELDHVKRIMISIDNKLKQYGNYAAKSDEITQNFIVYEGEIEFMEIVARD